MATTPAPGRGIRVTDTDGDSAIFTREGDGLVINATSADHEAKVDLILTPEDLDHLLDLVDPSALAYALQRDADGIKLEMD